MRAMTVNRRGLKTAIMRASTRAAFYRNIFFTTDEFGKTIIICRNFVNIVKQSARVPLSRANEGNNAYAYDVRR